MVATTKLSGTKLVRVHYERGKSGFYFAKSEDIDGLVVSGSTQQELDLLVPTAITNLYRACGVKVIVTQVDQKVRDDDNNLWAAVPADLAKQKLKELAA